MGRGVVISLKKKKKYFKSTNIFMNERNAAMRACKITAFGHDCEKKKPTSTAIR